MNLKQLLKEADALRNPIIDRIKKDWAVERNSSNNTRFKPLGRGRGGFQRSPNIRRPRITKIKWGATIAKK